MVTTANENGTANGNGNALSNKDKLRAEEDLRTKPRGFFADQFEVCLPARTQLKATADEPTLPGHQLRCYVPLPSLIPGRHPSPTPEPQQLRCPFQWNRSRDLETDQWRSYRLCRRRWCAISSAPKILNTIADILIGTGGTIAGTGQFLKSMNEDVSVALADPEGSGLYNKVTDPVFSHP